MHLCFSNTIMLHILIESYKPKNLHQVFIEYNLTLKFLRLLKMSLTFSIPLCMNLDFLLNNSHIWKKVDTISLCPPANRNKTILT